MMKKGERKNKEEGKEMRRGGTEPSQVALDRSQGERGLVHSSATFPVND